MEGMCEERKLREIPRSKRSNSHLPVPGGSGSFKALEDAEGGGQAAEASRPKVRPAFEDRRKKRKALEFGGWCPRLGRMDADWLRELCLSFPGATEQIQWGYDLVFKVGGKMFAVTPLEPAPVCLSFKASPENFLELTERQNVIPAPYMARAQWVALQTRDALRREELAGLLRESYEMVVAKLPKKVRETIMKPQPAGRTARNARLQKRRLPKKRKQRK